MVRRPSGMTGDKFVSAVRLQKRCKHQTAFVKACKYQYWRTYQVFVAMVLAQV